MKFRKPPTSHMAGNPSGRLHRLEAREQRSRLNPVFPEHYGPRLTEGAPARAFECPFQLGRGRQRTAR